MKLWLMLDIMYHVKVVDNDIVDRVLWLLIVLVTIYCGYVDMLFWPMLDIII